MAKDSTHLEKAKQIIAAVEGKNLSLEKLQDEAVALASLIAKEAKERETFKEKRKQNKLAQLLQDPRGKLLAMAITDQCFRSRNPMRSCDQLNFLIHHYGLPNFLDRLKRLAIQLFIHLDRAMPRLACALMHYFVRAETSRVILQGEETPLLNHIDVRRKQKTRVNINRIGEAVLGEEEAESRINLYCDDLTLRDIDYISVKISTIYSQINMLAPEVTLKSLEKGIRRIFRAAMLNNKGGDNKFVNLDMEEFRDLHLTAKLFQSVLSEAEFHSLSAGIALQSYLPDSFAIQRELTAWAKKRVADGGAPIKIRLVKGANLAMERVESSLNGWQQAPYSSKGEVDRNYKKMMLYGCMGENGQSVHLGIASHNLFDISFALLLRAQSGLGNKICFEMLEGMAPAEMRTVQALGAEMVAYCPAIYEEDFHDGVAYLIRRLDENSSPQNFLRHLFSITSDQNAWREQESAFRSAVADCESISEVPLRNQDRRLPPEPVPVEAAFTNEPNSDWAVSHNVTWAHAQLKSAFETEISPIPLVIADQEIFNSAVSESGQDPSRPDVELYRYALAEISHLDMALNSSREAQMEWAARPLHERTSLLSRCAHALREAHGSLIGTMAADGGKAIYDSDIEINEAIDFVEYYLRNSEIWHRLPGVSWRAKGTVVVAPPWNFPCSIPVGGIAAALSAGNSVIFKPAPEAVYVGWLVASCFWKAGIDKKLLQFMPCSDDPIGSALICDDRVDVVLLTGATTTAQLFLQLDPFLQLYAETGGKNSMIITAAADRDQAIKDLVASAFGHSGQKCSACSLAILEAEIYHDAHFRDQLKDAAASLHIGSAWDPSSKIIPLIREPNDLLYRALTRLEEGEEWLLKPQRDPKNPQLWSPGIKLGVKSGGFTHQNEFFGPVLGVICAENLESAITIANDTPYGLTAGIHTLDVREQKIWKEKIIAGNCYVNRTITGAIVQRQPFGGCKKSSFGRGAKAGGPNYLAQLMDPVVDNLTVENADLEGDVAALSKALSNGILSPEESQQWLASAKSYSYYWKNHFSKEEDVSLIMGQDNMLYYKAHQNLTARFDEKDSLVDILCVITAALTVGSPVVVSADEALLMQLPALPLRLVAESDKELADRAKNGNIERLRVLSPPSRDLMTKLCTAGCNVDCAAVVSHGRIELLHYLREVAFSYDYHRYGNLGERAEEF